MRLIVLRFFELVSDFSDGLSFLKIGMSDVYYDIAGLFASFLEESFYGLGGVSAQSFEFPL